MSRRVALLTWFLFPAIVGAFVFGGAGRFDLPAVWAVLGTLAAFAVASGLLIDRDLLRERAAPGPGNADRLTRPLAGLLLPAHWLLAGLDARFGWSPIPVWARAAGAVLYAVGCAAVLWAMTANRFYSSVVRIQDDRAHHAVRAGPYRIVRHPGYAATIACALSAGLALGSFIAMVPALLFAALFVRRTIVEDRLLRRDLEGYAEYARGVRYRLLPGVF
jgi:protein-S-isoprenylcysteine O-methyltransferase Ste14